MNWGYFILRLVIGLAILGLLFLSQRFWYRAIWRNSAKWKHTVLRVAVRLAYVLALVFIVVMVADGFRMGRHHLLPRVGVLSAFTGLWFTSALFGYIAVKAVRILDLAWSFARKSWHTDTAVTPATAEVEQLQDQIGRAHV